MQLTEINEKLRVKLTEIFEMYEKVCKEKDNLLKINEDYDEEVVNRKKYDILLDTYNNNKLHKEKSPIICSNCTIKSGASSPTKTKECKCDWFYLT